MMETYPYDAEHDDFALASFAGSSFNESNDVGLLDESWTDSVHNPSKGSGSFMFDFDPDRLLASLNPNLEDDSNTDRDSLETEVYSNHTEDSSDSGDDFPTADAIFNRSFDHAQQQGYQPGFIHPLPSNSGAIHYNKESYGQNTFTLLPENNVTPQSMEYAADWHTSPIGAYLDSTYLTQMSEKAILKSRFDARLANSSTAPILKSSRANRSQSIGSTNSRVSKPSPTATTTSRRVKTVGTLNKRTTATQNSSNTTQAKKRQRSTGSTKSSVNGRKAKANAMSSIPMPHASLMNQTSAFRGVSCCGRDRKWQARIRDKELNRVKYLGRFVSQIEAAFEYDKFARSCKGHQALTNFADLSQEQADQLTKAYEELGYVPQELFHLLGEGMESRMLAVQQRALNASRESKIEQAKKPTNSAASSAAAKKRKRQSIVSRGMRTLDTTTPPPVGVVSNITPRESQLVAPTSSTMSPSSKKTKFFGFPSPTKETSIATGAALQRKMFAA